jgi:hypothetical protein
MPSEGLALQQEEWGMLKIIGHAHLKIKGI